MSSLPRLILLNGPPGVGKSTIAQRYADDHPLTLDLDIDQVRRLLGQWRATPGEAGLLARQLALVAARTHLAAGHDVVVPQYVARPEFLDQLAQVARDARASWHELVLMDDEETVLARFAERTRAAAAPEHLDAHDLVGGTDELVAMYHRLSAVVADRPQATVVRTRPGEPARTYRDVLHAIAGRPGGV